MKIFVFFLLCVTSGQGIAKGLDTLSEEAPIDDPKAELQENSEVTESPEKPEAGMSNLTPGPGLYIVSTSLGWVRVNSKAGKVSTSGASDLSIARKFEAPFPLPGSFYLTYRYLPVAFTVKEDNRYYRGTWENHLVGGELRTTLNSLTGVARGEVGIVAEHRRPADGLKVEENGRKRGIELAVSGGPEYAMLDGGALKVGGRLGLGLGFVSSLQLAVTVGFTF